ncbi:MAG TPA: hypothetical protein VGC41_13965, partial [Kofleriaceae bacterium]
MEPGAQVAIAAAKKTADDKNRKEDSLGLHHLQSMSVPQVIDAVGFSAEVASYVVQERTETLGELLRVANAEGKPAAFTLLAATRYALRSGSLDPFAVVLSANRLTGEGSQAVKQSIEAILIDLKIIGVHGPQLNPDVNAAFAAQAAGDGLKNPRHAAMFANF